MSSTFSFAGKLLLSFFSFSLPLSLNTRAFHSLHIKRMLNIMNIICSEIKREKKYFSRLIIASVRLYFLYYGNEYVFIRALHSVFIHFFQLLFISIQFDSSPFFHSFLLTFLCFHRVLCSVVIYFVCMCYFLHLILFMHILGLVLSRLSECELDCVLCFFNGFPRLDRFAFFCRSPKTRFVLRDCRRQFWSTHERNRSSR